MFKISIHAIAVVAFVAAFAVLIGTTPAEARQWTCHATLFLNDSSFSYTVPSWPMSGPSPDREKSCLKVIQRDWIPNPPNPSTNRRLWLNLGVPPKDQKSLCDTGGTFRVEYGFDTRKKAWTFGPSARQMPTCQGNHFI